MIDKGIRYEVQGGVKNYLGKQKEVKAPVKWKSSPDHPETELAYITKKEKDLLIKSDLHGSLKGSVNRGPSGIISLNGWGDASDGFGGGAPGPGDTGGEGGDSPQDNSTSQFGGGSPSTGGDGPTARDLAMGAGGKQKTGTITDVNELSKATGTDFSGGATTSPALEAARLANQQALKDLKKVTYKDVQTKIPPYIPYSGLINTGLNFLGEIGFKKNKDFFAENVAGKYGYGYGYEDFEKYMEDRLSGKVGAYGNENMGQNAINERAGGDDRQDVSGILENLLQPGIFPGEESQVPPGFIYTPYSNQVVIAPGSQGLASLTGGQGFLQNII
jgi:hypothetical protein